MASAQPACASARSEKSTKALASSVLGRPATTLAVMKKAGEPSSGWTNRTGMPAACSVWA